MRATIMYGAGDVRIENVPDASLIEPTDALVSVSRACICGSDLWPYKLKAPDEGGQRMGHEAIGVVEEVGDQVTTLALGDTVIVPFAWSDGSCPFCRDGITTSCVHGGFFDGAASAMQAEKLRVPYADSTAVVVPPGTDESLMPSLLLWQTCISRGITPPSRGGSDRARRSR